MKKIEFLWNIVYYFIFKRYKQSFMPYDLTYKPLFFEDVKSNRSISLMVILGLLFFISLGLVFCGIFTVPIRGSFVFIPGIMSLVFNYYVLWRNNKCVIYFQEFEKQSKGWKRKWNWISYGVIIAIFSFLIGSIKFVDYSLHHSRVWPGHPQHSIGRIFVTKR